MISPELLAVLPAVNAALVATSGALVLLGLRLIRRRRRRAHQYAMIAAAILQGLFLVLYIARVSIAGTTPFRGQGLLRPVYYALLGSHIALALGQLPFIALTLWWGLAGRYAAHKAVARRTYPMWIFVSASGVLVYFLLHRWT